MRPKERWKISLSIVASLWDGTTRITYAAFIEGLASRRKRMRKDRRGELPDPSQPTYSHIWNEFCDRREIVRGTRDDVRELLLQGVAERAWDPNAPDEEATQSAARFLSSHGITPPFPSELLRRIRTVRTGLRRREQDIRDKVLSTALGVVLFELPLAKRFTVAHEVLRFPPADQGKVGVANLVTEDTIRREIETCLQVNGLSLPTLQSHPDIDESFQFSGRSNTGVGGG
jgi:hypothetical protein